MGVDKIFGRGGGYSGSPLGGSGGMLPQDFFFFFFGNFHALRSILVQSESRLVE